MSWDPAAVAVADAAVPVLLLLRWLLGSLADAAVPPMHVARRSAHAATSRAALDAADWQRKAMDAAEGSGGGSLLLTCADGPEGFALAAALLDTPSLRGKLAVVVAAVESPGSPQAMELRRKGATVRPMEPMQAGVFEGVDWAFILSPLSSDRLEKGKAMLEAARAAGAPQIMLLSVVGAEAAMPGGSTLGQYWALEKHLRGTAWGQRAVVLRTFFYQQNLAFWAADVRASRGRLRLPLPAGHGSGGFAALHQRDVAAAAAAIAQHPRALLEHVGRTFNLTGPQALSARGLGEVASAAIGQQVAVLDGTSREEAMEVLNATGQLDSSEVDLLLDLLQLQPPLCSAGASFTCPSPDVTDLTGKAATPISHYFNEDANSFRWRGDEGAPAWQ